jgi:hypothetical protein
MTLEDFEDNEFADLVTIYVDNGAKADCYNVESLKQFWVHGDKLFKSRANKNPNLSQPVYKLPSTGAVVSKRTHDRILRGEKKIKLKNKGTINISGRQHVVSAAWGSPNTFYN